MAGEIKIYINAVRANMNMTQDEWAKELGVDRQTVQNWEAGKTKPDIEQVRKMSKLSSIPIDFIFCRV